ncbi:MAG: hypothetical protein WA117_10510 [Verrucomicrobiia bacterium]
MKFSHEKPELRVTRLSYVNDRWKQLHELEKEWSERVLKFLFLTNSGGAAAALSFIGTSEKIRVMFYPRLALCSFVLGVILVGVMHAVIYHHMKRLYDRWREEGDQYLEDKLDWEALIANDGARWKGRKVDAVLGYIAFFCFIVGCLLGFVTFLTIPR